MKNKNLDELIDRFIHGDLSEKEARDLQHAIDTDPEVREAYNLHKGVENAVCDPVAGTYRRMLDDIYKEQYGREEGVFRHTFKKYYPWAALLVVLIGISVIILMNRDRQPLNEHIYAEYYSPYEFPNNYRSPSGTDLLDAGMDYFNKGEYREALQKAELKLEKSHGNIVAIYLAGVSLLGDGECETAISFLSQVAASENIALKEFAAWYEALAYIKMNDLEQATKCFANIVADKGYFADKAEEVLELINR